MVGMKNTGGNPYSAMWLQEPFPPRTPCRCDASHPRQTKNVGLSMPCSYRGNKQPLEDSVSCESLPGNGNHLRNTMQSCSYSFSTWQKFTPEQQLHLKLHLLRASPCSKASFCSSIVFLVNPTWCSPSAALTSPGGDNPPKADSLSFKALKSQSAGLHLPNSVPDGIKPSWAKLGS